MSEIKQINSCKIRLVKEDVTLYDSEAFVYYATSNLALGAGFGNAISMRGGPSIKKELDELSPIEVCEVAVTGAGELKANHIIHANGPKFQEEETENKLTITVVNTLKAAEQKGVKRIAFPPMGTGFYGIPLAVSAKIMLQAFREYLANGSDLEEIAICVVDNREFEPFRAELAKLN